MLAELRARSRNGDAERFRRAAHSLKSNSNTFGALTLGALARELELGGLDADATPRRAARRRWRPNTRASPRRLTALRMRELSSGRAACWSSTTTRSTGCCCRATSSCMGHRVATAENGRVALEMLRREPFDLVLLDIEMPEMDGFAGARAD